MKNYFFATKNAKSAKKKRCLSALFACSAVKCLLLLLLLSISANAAVTFTPATGQPGDTITITGTGFSTAATTNVWFNHLTLADFDIVSSTQLRVVIPPGAQSGVLSVNAANNSAASFDVAPRIDSFTPEIQAVTNLITISGANFISGTTNTLVIFAGTNGSLTTTGTVVSVSQVTTKVPQGATNGPLKVITKAGSGFSTDIFIPSNRPLITDFTPTAGTNGTTVLINGANFITGTSIKFGTVAATTVTIVSRSQISTKVPAGATNNPITVTNASGSFTTTSNFITGAKPIITGFSPAAGKANDAITITGLNFSTVNAVSFNGHAATLTSLPTATQITIQVPVGATTGPITVGNPQGTGTSSNSFITGTGPVVTNFSPTFGPPGTIVLVSGFNFTGLTGFKFNNTATSATATADTQIQATVPAGATNGPLKVTVGANTFTTTSNFFVVGGAPIITNISPASGVRGTLVTITGNNLTNVTGVQFNGTNAIFLTPTDPGTLKAYVPATATSGRITVTTSGGIGSSPTNFYIQPRIDAFTPTNGIVGATFAINGRNLTNAVSITVDGRLYDFQNMATQMVCAIPSNATTGIVVVTTPAGTIITTNKFAIMPKIYDFTPTIGPGGTVVTITGTSLFNVSSVKFGSGGSATPFNLQTNQLQVSVPTNAATGPLQVTAPDGTDTSSNIFTATYPSELVLTKTVSPQVTTVGQPVIYTLFLTNKGPSISTGVKIVDELPEALTLNSISSTAGTCSVSNDFIVCDIGVMNTNTSVTLTVTATPFFAGIWTNSANGYVTEPDLNIDNNFSSTKLFVVSEAQRSLSIAKLNATNTVISWPSSVVSFVLQYNTNLGSTNWVTAPPGPTNGATIYFTNNLSTPQIFFRLRMP